MADAETYLPLHPLEFRILLVLLDGPNHGYEIIRAIETEDGSGVIHPANLYRRIRDLLAKELLEEVDGPRADDAEARRRYLKATALGRRVARAEALRLQSLVRDPRVKQLLQGAR